MSNGPVWDGAAAAGLILFITSCLVIIYSKKVQLFFFDLLYLRERKRCRNDLPTGCEERRSGATTFPKGWECRQQDCSHPGRGVMRFRFCAGKGGRDGRVPLILAQWYSCTLLVRYGRNMPICQVIGSSKVSYLIYFAN